MSFISCFALAKTLLVFTILPSTLDTSILVAVSLLKWGTIFSMIFMDWDVFSEHGTLYWGGKEEDLCSNLSAMRRIPSMWALKRQGKTKEQPRKVNPALSKINKWGKKKLHWGSWMADTGPERLWNSRPWRYWKLNWPMPSVTCPKVEVTPALSRDWTQWPPEVPPAWVIL